MPRAPCSTIAVVAARHDSDGLFQADQLTNGDRRLHSLRAHRQFSEGGPNLEGTGSQGSRQISRSLSVTFDRVYEGASRGTSPSIGVQTVSVPPGGATVVD